MNPQETLLMIVTAVKDAAIEKKMTQFIMQVDPTETGKSTKVRIIVVPEEMDIWPSCGSGSTGNG